MSFYRSHRIGLGEPGQTPVLESMFVSIVDWNGRSVLEPKEATRYLRFHKPFTMEIDVDRSYKSRFGSEIPSILGTWHWAELTINGHHLDRIEFPYLNAIEKGQHYIEVGFTFPRIPKLA